MSRCPLWRFISRSHEANFFGKDRPYKSTFVSRIEILFGHFAASKEMVDKKQKGSSFFLSIEVSSILIASMNVAAVSSGLALTRAFHTREGLSISDAMSGKSSIECKVAASSLTSNPENDVPSPSVIRFFPTRASTTSGLNFFWLFHLTGITVTPCMRTKLLMDPTLRIPAIYIAQGGVSTASPTITAILKTVGFAALTATLRTPVI